MLCQCCDNSNCIVYFCYECIKHICYVCIENHLDEYNDHLVAAVPDPTSEQSDQKQSSDSDLTSSKNEKLEEMPSRSSLIDETANRTASNLPNRNLNKLKIIQTTCNYHHELLTSYCITCNKIMCNSCHDDHSDHLILIIESKPNMSRTSQAIGYTMLQDMKLPICTLETMKKTHYKEYAKLKRHVKKRFGNSDAFLIFHAAFNDIIKQIEEVKQRNS